MNMASLLRKAGYSASIAAAVAFSSTSPATTMGLSEAPLFLANGSEPNLIMAIDDSGSMDNEVLFRTNDGAAWWRNGDSGDCLSANGDRSFAGCIANTTGTRDVPETGTLNFNYAGGANGTWKKFVYLFPNGSSGDFDTARRRAGDADNDHFAIPPIAAYAWARSPDHNKAYFNPDVLYSEWVDSGTHQFEPASPEAARFDGVFDPTFTINLTRDIAGNANADLTTSCAALPAAQVPDNWYFKVYSGMTLPANTCIRRTGATNVWEEVSSTGCEIGVANGCHTNVNANYQINTASRVAIRYFPATFYLAADTVLSPDYGYKAANVLVGFAPNGTTQLKGYEIKPDHFDSVAQYNAAIQNFANWFTYYRKRHQALRAGLGEAFNSVTGIRVDGYTINNRTTVSMASINDAANKAALYNKFYTQWVRSGGTPNRSAVAHMISSYQRRDNSAPITSACQKNFGMLFTDGFSNAPANNDGIRGRFGDEDNGKGAPFEDGTPSVTGTMADATMFASTNNLRDDLPTNRVLVPKKCQTGTAAEKIRLDCNRNPHMNFFAVTLGAKGLQYDPDLDQDPFRSAPTWPRDFYDRHPSAVDDMWHATVNGRGQLLNARTPDKIATQLNAVLSAITAKNSTAASAATNAGTVSTNSFIYQAMFDSDTWTGKLISVGIDGQTGALDRGDRDGDGQVDPGRVDTLKASTIPAPDLRKIITTNSAGAGVPFTWTDLSGDAVRVRQLAPAAALTDAARATEAQRMLEYLRGSEQNEGIESGNYRVRRGPNGANDEVGSNKLGDIVSSAPLFVGKPAFRYPPSFQGGYAAFVDRWDDRPPLVYVGANDGMLHAFYGTGDNRGEEAFAYIPGAVFKNLPELASRDYGHRFYVDGSPSMGDAFFGSAWHTVVAGGLNKGGQGIYALDVTDPDNFDETKVLFEFTDLNDKDLGFTYSQPSIAKLPDGQWYVIFGNGYNSMLNDDAPGTLAANSRVSATGNAVLFLKSLQTGIVTKIDTGVGFYTNNTASIPYGNGLSTPSVVDSDGDRVVDAVYAGDLYGNMWKFDMTTKAVAFGGQPLFIATNDDSQVQPITVRPEVSRGPNGIGTIVLFGTGKYLELADKEINPERTQSFYGIVDDGNRVQYTGLRSTVLTKQSVEYETTVTRTPTGGTGSIISQVRVTSNVQTTSSGGWYIDLKWNTNQGERSVTNPTVRDNRVIFTTLKPSENPCDFGGTSWLMELNVLTGARLGESPFDLNRDGKFDEQDKVPEGAGSSNNVPPSGLGFDQIVTQPIIVEGRFGTEGAGLPVQYKYLPGSNGNVEVVIEKPATSGVGRQSWRQIR